MTNSSNNSRIRRDAGPVVRPARLDYDLISASSAGVRRADPRLVDPHLARAFEEAVCEAREEARREGYADGYAAGERAARADMEQELQRRVAAASEALAEKERELARAAELLGEATRRLAERVSSELAGLEDVIVRAAYLLAETLLGRELQLADAPVCEAVRRALAVIPADVPAIVRCHPDDVSRLRDLDALGAADRRVVVVPDSQVEPGSCTVDAGATHVDAALGAALVRVRRVLGIEGGEEPS
ncbi:MAG: flagellar assembly protein FliH [Acidothermus sp.]|nr:flagellar assembly protein FliH [Acidothermus sp.]